MNEYRIEILRDEPRKWIALHMEYNPEKAVESVVSLWRLSYVLAARAITNDGVELLHMPPRTPAQAEGERGKWIAKEMRELVTYVEKTATEGQSWTVGAVLEICRNRAVLMES